MVGVVWKRFHTRPISTTANTAPSTQATHQNVRLISLRSRRWPLYAEPSSWMSCTMYFMPCSVVASQKAIVVCDSACTKWLSWTTARMLPRLRRW